MGGAAGTGEAGVARSTALDASDLERELGQAPSPASAPKKAGGIKVAATKASGEGWEDNSWDDNW